MLRYLLIISIYCSSIEMGSSTFYSDNSGAPRFGKRMFFDESVGFSTYYDDTPLASSSEKRAFYSGSDKANADIPAIGKRVHYAPNKSGESNFKVPPKGKNQFYNRGNSYEHVDHPIIGKRAYYSPSKDVLDPFGKRSFYNAECKDCKPSSIIGKRVFYSNDNNENDNFKSPTLGKRESPTKSGRFTPDFELGGSIRNELRNALQNVAATLLRTSELRTNNLSNRHWDVDDILSVLPDLKSVLSSRWEGQDYPFHMEDQGPDSLIDWEPAMDTDSAILHSPRPRGRHQSKFDIRDLLQ